MLIENLVQRFTDAKNYSPSHANELLDFLQKSYISGELSIVEYKKLFCELTKHSAEKPSEFFMKTKLFNFEYEIAF